MSTERAVLAGGCFWGVQELVRKMPGVISSRVGYSGGDVANATYRNHGTHAEAVEIVFDPSKISYRDLLEFFFQIHDPTTRNRQGNDMGASYRSAIYYTTDEQKRVAEDTIADVDASGLWPGKVVTTIEPVGPPPVQKGGPELLAGAQGPKSTRLAATWADGISGFTFDLNMQAQKEAFDLAREPESVRQRYGPGLGQELLLARRLCEAGAGFVTLNNGYWDFHSGLIPGCNSLCPPLDHAVAAFMDDVEARGLSDDILLVVTGEFGRSPRVGSDANAGRDHWAPLNDALLIGGGLRMGQAIGDSDARGGQPRTRPITPGDFFSTVLHVLGIDPRIQYTHPSGRPMYMVEDGRVMSELV